MLRKNAESDTQPSHPSAIMPFIASIPQAVASVPYWFIDQFNLARYQQAFIFSEMYERARHTNIAWIRTAPEWVAALSHKIPQAPKIPSGIYVITGSRANIMQVTDYGESNGDETSRFFFKFLDKLVERPNLLSTLLKDSKQEKKFFRDEMINPSAAAKTYGEQTPLDLIAQTAKIRARKMFNAWSAEVSYQDQMTHYGANMVGECVLGIPELDMKYIPQLRKVGDLLVENEKNPHDIQKCAEFLKQLNREVYLEYFDKIMAADKFIKKDFEMYADAEKDPIEELVKRSIASMYAVEGNLSTTIMGAVALVNNHPAIKDKLSAEISAFRATLPAGSSLSVDQLRKELPYLDAIYLEVMRYMAMAAVVPRKTSVASQLKIVDESGVKHFYAIPAHALLFAPLRSKHLDPQLWKNPREFDPARFDFTFPMTANQTDAEYAEAKKIHDKDIQKNRDLVTPFSIGMRACPGQFGFVEVIVKQTLLESLKYHFTFDHDIEIVPTYTQKTAWQSTYYAEISTADSAKARPSM